MKKYKKIILRTITFILALPVLFLAFMVFVIGPVDTSESNSIQYTGTVSQIEEGTSNDIVFHFADHPHNYYINRGLERGLELDELQRQLLGKQVVIWYAKSWISPGGHMTRLTYANKVLFNEWKEVAQK